MAGLKSTMVVFLCLVAQLVALAPSQTVAVDANATWDADRIVDEPESYTGQRIFLKANLTVESNLTLENVELVIFGTSNGSVCIEVVAGGFLSLLAGTYLHSSNPAVHYTFIVRPGAKLVMNDTRMNDCGWDDIANNALNPPCYQGLYVATSVATITCSRLWLNGVGLVVDTASSPLISGCNISENEGDGIRVLNGSSPQIYNNVLYGNAASYPTWACDLTSIYSERSSPDISNNTISAKAPGLGARPLTGIYLTGGGAPIVRTNTILDHDGYGSYRGLLSMETGASIYNNRFVGNLDGMDIFGGTSLVTGNTIDRGQIRSTITSSGIQDGSHSTFRDNVMKGFSYGIYFNDGANSSYSNENLSDNEEGVDGFSFGTPYKIIMDSCKFSRNDMDVALTNWHGASGGGALTLIDPVYSPAKASVTGADSKLTVIWRCNAQVLFENGSRAVASAQLKFTDTRGVEAMSQQTGPDGRVGTFLLDEYVRTSSGREGRSPYTVSASYDRWSNRTEGMIVDRSLELTIFLDDIAPWIGISSPPDGFLTNKATVKVSGTGEPGTSIVVNDKAAQATPDGSWSATVALREGDNTIAARAIDRGGNSAGASISVRLDSVPPPLVVSSPQDGTLTNDSRIAVSGIAPDLSANLTLNGVGVNRTSDGSFSRMAGLVEGENLLVFECRDPAGNLVSVTRRVVLDTKAPELFINGPADGTITGKGTVTVSGTAEPGCPVTLNGVPVATDGGGFSRQVELADGVNRFVLTCKDKAGNIASVLLVVTLDTIAPVISLISPVEGAVHNSMVVAVRGSTEAGATVRVNGVKVEQNGKEFSTCVTLADEGANSILLEVADAAGNLAQKSVTVVLDTLPPALKITAPVSGFLTNQRSVEVKGKTEAGASVSIGGSSVSANEKGYFNMTVELPAEGSNVLTFVARDKAGNSDSASVMVTRDTVLYYNITSPENGSKVEAKAVTIVGDAEPGAVVTIDGRTVQLSENGSFSLDVPLESGLNSITISISDRAGNQRTETIEVSRENAPGGTGKSTPGVEGALLALLLGIAVLLQRSRRAAAIWSTGWGQRAGGRHEAAGVPRPPAGPGFPYPTPTTAEESDQVSFREAATK